MLLSAPCWGPQAGWGCLQLLPWQQHPYRTAVDRTAGEKKKTDAGKCFFSFCGDKTLNKSLEDSKPTTIQSNFLSSLSVRNSACFGDYFLLRTDTLLDFSQQRQCLIKMKLKPTSTESISTIFMDKNPHINKWNLIISSVMWNSGAVVYLTVGGSGRQWRNEPAAGLTGFLKPTQRESVFFWNWKWLKEGPGLCTKQVLEKIQ